MTIIIAKVLLVLGVVGCTGNAVLGYAKGNAPMFWGGIAGAIAYTLTAAFL